MNDAQIWTQVKIMERQEMVKRHQLALQAMDAEKAERARFMKAYLLRSLVNRVAPRLATLVGL
jgi:hypothetical protein